MVIIVLSFCNLGKNVCRCIDLEIFVTFFGRFFGAVRARSVVGERRGIEEASAFNNGGLFSRTNATGVGRSIFCTDTARAEFVDALAANVSQLVTNQRKLDRQQTLGGRFAC